MRLGNVDHQKVSYVAEVLDELLELIKFVDERGSGAAAKTQHQRPVACRRCEALTQGAERKGAHAG